MKGMFAALGAAALLASSACAPKQEAEAEDENPAVAMSKLKDKTAPKFSLIAGDAIYVMIVDPKSNPASWRAAAKAHCDTKDFCQVMGWTDASMAAATLPMTDTEVSTKVFHFNINRTTGLDRAIWECEAMKKAGFDHCPEQVGE